VPVHEQTAATDWAQVSVGETHTCALKDDGRLSCWGANYHGELGINSVEDSRVPVQEYTAATDWAQVSTGYYHTCGLKNDGRVFCWGRNTSDDELGNEAIDSFVPLQEKTFSTDWTQVTSGLDHTCALKDDGRLFCWGDGAECGNNVTSKTILSLQDERGEADWAQVSVSNAPFQSEHACAVKTDGRLFCWGFGNRGQLGANSISTRSLPIQEYTAASDWLQVSAGGEHTCAVKTDGRLYCWGSNSHGELGNNSTQDSSVPIQEYTAAADWAQVSTGNDHTCALKNDGRIFCWGSGDRGDLGNNSTSDSLVPVQESTAATDWAQVSAGENETRAIKTDGRLFAWGVPIIGAPYYNYEPVEDSTVGNDWVQLSTYCGLKRNAAIFCFAPIADDSDTPLIGSVQEETAATDWVDVSTASNRACAIKIDGRLFCWGEGVPERFEGSNPNSAVVVQENTAATDWTKVSNGKDTTCALKSDNRLFCWGYQDRYTGRSNFGPVWPVE
jgi:alpha-tubulin suppressor-like RCC1 family protein